jgi:hypothetical protein
MEKNTLLENIKRIHQIIGIKPNILIESEINENNPLASEGAKLLAKIFTNLEKPLVVGSKNYSKAQVKTIIQKAGTSTLNADEKAVMQALSRDLISLDKKLITKLSSEVFGEMEKLGNRQLKTKFYSEVKAGLKELLPDTEVNKVIRNVDTKIAGKKPSGGTGSGGSQTNPNATLKPNNSPSPSSTNTNGLPPDADEIILNTAKSSPQAAAWMAQVDKLGFDDDITKLIKLDYAKPGMATKSVVELVEIGNGLVKGLSEKKYGWLKRSWVSFSNDPVKAITKSGKGIIAVIAMIALIRLALTGAAISESVRRWVENITGTSASDVLPNTNTETPSGGASKYN